MIIDQIDLNLDLPKVEMIVEQAFAITQDAKVSDWFSFEEMVRNIRQNRGVCLKALNDEHEIIGIIHAQVENPINGREGKEKWIITNLAVLPKETRKGVGTALLKAVEIEAKNHGAIKIYVHTNQGDNDVINFYKHAGYVDAGYIEKYYYSGSAVFLMKQLGVSN